WANTCSMNHSPSDMRTISTSGCGENLYMSNKVGCAVAHCPGSEYEYVYVCQYCPLEVMFFFLI
ncbi:cysteine-rich venom protein kaouthin-1-like, partial [Huso huso]